MRFIALLFLPPIAGPCFAQFTSNGLNHVDPEEIWQASGSVFGAETRHSNDAGESWFTLDQEPQVDIGGGLLCQAVPQD